jgi:hypothetical protein
MSRRLFVWVSNRRGDVGAWRYRSLAAALCLCSSLACAADPAQNGGAVIRDAAIRDTAISPLELEPLDQLSATTKRPLFSPIRRPPPERVAAAVRSPEPAPAPAPSLVLLGIVSEDGDGRAAIRSRDNDKVMRVRIGDDVGGWKVDRIEPRRLVLTLGERTVDFSLFSTAAKAVKLADPVLVERRPRQVH